MVGKENSARLAAALVPGTAPQPRLSQPGHCSHGTALTAMATAPTATAPTATAQLSQPRHRRHSSHSQGTHSHGTTGTAPTATALQPWHPRLPQPGHLQPQHPWHCSHGCLGAATAHGAALAEGSHRPGDNPTEGSHSPGNFYRVPLHSLAPSLCGCFPAFCGVRAAHISMGFLPCPLLVSFSSPLQELCLSPCLAPAGSPHIPVPSSPQSVLQRNS